MMVLAIHGVAGGWDEIIIAAVALLVLWVAVKLAGRQTTPDTDADDAVVEAEPGVAKPVTLESAELSPPSSPPATG